MQRAPTVSADGSWMWDGARWVPNPQRPPPYAPAMVPYQSARGRAQVASILIGVSILGTVLLTAGLVLIDFVPNPNDSQVLAFFLFEVFAFGVWVASWIAAIVLFCMWLHRVVRNMPALGSVDPRWSPARAVVYCFVPIVWLAHPLRSVLDAWRGSEPSARWLNVTIRRSMPTPPLLVGWWVLWLIGNYGSNVGSRLYGELGAVVDITGGICTAGASVLCIVIVRELTARQDRKQDLIQSGRVV